MAIVTARRAWTAFLVALLTVIAWWVHSISPQGPRRSFHRLPPELRIGHVMKRGLAIEGREAIIIQPGRTFFFTIRKQPFRSQVNVQVSGRVMPKSYYDHARELARSLKTMKSSTMPIRVLNTWNAEGWYIFLRWEEEPLVFTSEKAPREVVDLFYAIEKLPVASEISYVAPNKCWGLCGSTDILFETPLTLP